MRIGLDAQNAIRRARGQVELGQDGQPLDPEAIKKAEKEKAAKAAPPAKKKNG
ncbi:hypothetical protein QWZ10_11255 [Paracoccus cavernae]|uniref:Uncharacterized protein n=1 Tax=Paracoccus cavernae TaxID=1571207 RepID=A0ABT8D9W3_9RHOB|nr:hypothetical protein [Paracoccus cavernae]